MRVNSTYLVLSTCLLLGAMFSARAYASGKVADHSIYASLLARYVQDGVVDYKGLQKDEPRLDQYLEVLAQTRTRALLSSEKLAFYINAYNAWTLKLILGGYPEIKSIKDLGRLFKTPWEKKLVRIEGRVITLDQLEHEIIRPVFKDSRIHFVVNCASKSCPPLLSEPYVGKALNQQLDAAATAFIRNVRHNRLEGDTLWVSKLFKWYAEDFNDGVAAFFMEYADEVMRMELKRREKKIKVKYLDYDWSLNGF